MPITFNIETQGAPDAMGNAKTAITPYTVDNCLIAPIATPLNRREQLALEQGIAQVEVHIPREEQKDLGNSYIIYNDITFKIDNNNASYMPENTPTKWNRRLRGEAVEL